MATHDESVTLAWLPEQAQEDTLHATRLLPVEERPFQRVTKTLLSKTSLVRPIPNHLPSPPPEGETEETTEYELVDPARLQRFHEDILLDFANLESSIVRIQLIQSSNERERIRYATEKAKILETAQAVRDNSLQLHEQLKEAQRILELRKGYDDLATKILDDKKFKSRDESRAEIEKLEKEIEDLQQESADYDETWISRREHFERVVAEGEAMVRIIKGIKDEVEGDGDADKDDQMEDGDDPDDGKLGNSRNGTPAPDGRSPRPTDIGDSTPLPENGDGGGATPARPTNKFLDIEDNTRSNSRIGSPLSQAIDMSDDVEMLEESAALANSDAGDHDQAKTGDDEYSNAAPSVNAAEHGENMDET